MKSALTDALEGIDKNDLEPVTLRGVGLAIGDLAAKLFGFAIVIGAAALILMNWKLIVGWIALIGIGGFILATGVAAIVAIWKAALR